MYVGDAKATVTNSGTIDVQAVTGNGGSATAYGVWVQDNQTGLPPAADDVFTFTNDGGTIIARQSVDGGTTWQRGMAVDVSSAPNASVINLLGNGAIYGDIAVQAGDTINVKGGKTVFDGIINPASMPAGGITAADLDTGLAGVGTLNISDGGNLELVSHNAVAAMDNGASYVFVDTLNMGATGTITFDLPTTSSPLAPIRRCSRTPQTSMGRWSPNVHPANGLFADSYSWQNVIDANTRTGTFDQCLLGGPNAGSVLLSLTCSYDSNANVDLALTRKAFGPVAGLNGNGTEVGVGLDCIYNVNLTGGARKHVRATCS